MIYSDDNSSAIIGGAFNQTTGQGYFVRETLEGDLLTQFESTAKENLKIQSSPSVDDEYCNYANETSYVWSDLPNSDFVLSDSTQFTDSDPTSNVTGLLYDNNTSFTPGEMKDTGATTGQIRTGQNEFTEIEYSIKPSATASGSYCFRLIDADPNNDNQVGGNPNYIFNVLTADYDPDNYNYYAPITINGIILSKNSINIIEGTTTDSYSIKLAGQPTDDVTVTINADDSRITLSPDSTPLTPTETTLTFGTGDWDREQFITVTSLNNGIVDGTTTDLIRHTVSSTDSAYNNILAEPVQSVVTDYGSTTSNVLAQVSGEITFTPPLDFSFPAVTLGTQTPNFSPTLTLRVDETRGTESDYVITLQTSDFCKSPGVCIPLDKVFTATANLVNTFNTFTAVQIGQFISNYLQSGENLSSRDTYVHTNSADDRPLSAPITLIDTRNIPSGDTTNPLQGVLDFDLHLMIDYESITGLEIGTYTTTLTFDLNSNPT